MIVRIEMKINIDHPDAQQATDKQIEEWVEFNLGDRRELNPSPIDCFDTSFDFEPKLVKVINIKR